MSNKVMTEVTNNEFTKSEQARSFSNFIKFEDPLFWKIQIEEKFRAALGEEFDEAIERFDLETTGEEPGGNAGRRLTAWLKKWQERNNEEGTDIRPYYRIGLIHNEDTETIDEELRLDYDIEEVQGADILNIQIPSFPKHGKRHCVLVLNYDDEGQADIMAAEFADCLSYLEGTHMLVALDMAGFMDDEAREDRQFEIEMYHEAAKIGSDHASIVDTVIEREQRKQMDEEQETWCVTFPEHNE